MIRNFKINDLDRVMQLWLVTNIEAHSFIQRDYWELNYSSVKELMPQARISVYEEKCMVQGFVGVIDNFVAGIFVSSDLQSKGIGKLLLDYVKEQENQLSLCVYKKNTRAVIFYLREGFIASKEQVDENTHEVEIVMEWKK